MSFKKDKTPAATVYPAKFNYKIQISPDYTTATKLFRASNILHEMVHAYFMSIVDDYNASGNPSRNYDLNNFSSLFQAFCDKKYPPSSTVAANVHHLEMANQYVDAITSALQEYQTGTPVTTGTIPDQIYIDLAWGGLKDAPVFGEKYNPGSDDYVRILNRYRCESVGRTVETGTLLEQKPIGKPCN